MESQTGSRGCFLSGDKGSGIFRWPSLRPLNQPSQRLMAARQPLRQLLGHPTALVVPVTPMLLSANSP